MPTKHRHSIVIDPDIWERLVAETQGFAQSKSRLVNKALRAMLDMDGAPKVKEADASPPTR